MRRSMGRAVVVLLLLVPLVLPSGAVAGEILMPGLRAEPWDRLFAAVRALLAPVVGLWSDSRGGMDPNGSPASAPTAEAGNPVPVEDGRGDMDPNG